MFSTENLLDKKVLDELPKLLKSIKGNWPVLPSGVWNSSGIQAILRQLHHLAKKSEAAGLVNILGMTHDLDKMISDIHEENEQPNLNEMEQLGSLLNELTRAINATYSPNRTATDDFATCDILYLHRGDASDGPIVASIVHNGWKVQQVSEIEALLPLLNRGQAKALLVDTQFLPKARVLTKALTQLRREEKISPEMIFISRQCDVEKRLEMLRVGATQCFSEPVNIHNLMMSIKEILSPQLKACYRVLIVEDKVSEAKFAEKLLQRGGYETQIVTDPWHVLEAVHRIQPDLILMNLYLPGVNGIELMKVIRIRKTFSVIPIVFLSAKDDLEKRTLALYSGADDYLTKPLHPQYLLATVLARIQRSKQILSAAVDANLADVSTGMPNRRWLLQELDVHYCHPNQNSHVGGLFSIILGELDTDFEDWRENPLLTRVVDVVRVAINKRDILARTGKQSFSILAARTDQNQLEQLGANIYQQIDEELRPGAGSEVRWGIGYVVMNTGKVGAYTYLSQSETAATQALERDYKGCLGNVMLQIASTQLERGDSLQEQVQMALKSGHVQFREQCFVASRGGGGMIVDLLPGFSPRVDLPQESSNIYLATERFGLSHHLNRLVCRHAIHRAGELMLHGSPDKVCVRLLSSAVRDGGLLEFIQMELRRFQVVGTGLIVEFDLPIFVKNLKQGKAFLGELSALGIGILLRNFVGNDTAFKILAYLKADAVRLHPSLMQYDAGKVSRIASLLRALGVKIVLPGMSKMGQISLHWSEITDYVQAEYLG
jgi:DNA-binding response OmpR family regulator/EAL domain-containing protein (putative c-di-GMP-specific phosphodiesterase class I)